MDIIATFSPPRFCQMAGRAYWLRPLALEDYALLIAWLDDVLPGRADRVLAPKFGDDESQDALGSQTGRAVLAYASLRHAGVSWEEAAAISREATEEEWARLLDVMFSRRRYLKPGGGGRDLAEGWWGPSVLAMAEKYQQTMEPLGRLTLDQIDCMATEGGADENPIEHPLTEDEAIRHLKEHKAKEAAAIG